MQGSPESKPSFIDRAITYLGFERGRSRWEYLGAGFKLAAVAEGVWAMSDLAMGDPFTASIKALSAFGIGLAGHMLHDRYDQFSRFRDPGAARGVVTALASGNLALTGALHLAISTGWSPVEIARNAWPLAFMVLLTEVIRRKLNANKQPGNL